MLRTLSKYFFVQVFAYGLDLGGFLLFSTMLHPIGANVIGKILAGTFAFVAHRHVTFDQAASTNLWRQLCGYGFLMAFNIPLSSSILAGLLHVVRWPVAAKVIADAVCIVFTFYVSKRIVFASGLRQGDP